MTTEGRWVGMGGWEGAAVKAPLIITVAGITERGLPK